MCTCLTVAPKWLQNYAELLWDRMQPGFEGALTWTLDTEFEQKWLETWLGGRSGFHFPIVGLFLSIR